MNDFSGIEPRHILPLLGARLKQKTTMVNKVYRDSEVDEVSDNGKTVSVTLPVYFDEAKDHGASSTPESIKAATADVKMNSHVTNHIQMSDYEISTSAAAGIVPQAMEAQIDSIARRINGDLLRGFSHIYNYSTTGASTFGHESIVTAADQMDVTGIPEEGRNLILCPKHSNDFLKTNRATADSEMNRKGIIGEWMGMDVSKEVRMPSHTAGDAAGYTVVGVSGDVIEVSGGTGSFVAGDLIEIAGAGRFSVVDVNGLELKCSGSTFKDVVADAAVTVVDLGDFSIAMNPAACVLAFRKMKGLGEQSNAKIDEHIDRDTGITLRMIRWFDPNTLQNNVKFDVLYGFAWVRPELALRVGK